MQTSTLRQALVALAMLASTVAHAQYAWIDEKGMRQYADRPPPPSTPVSKILKAPRGAMPVEAPAPLPEKAGTTVAEREADYQKRMAASADSARKQAKEKEIADAKAYNCASAAQAKSSLETGRRLRWTNKNGADVVMTEEDKAAEMARTAKVLKDCK